MAGLSTHSSTVLSFYLNQGKRDAVILTETHRELASHEIINYSAFGHCGTTGQGEVSNLVKKDIAHVPKIFKPRLSLSGPFQLITKTNFIESRLYTTNQLTKTTNGYQSARGSGEFFF